MTFTIHLTLPLLVIASVVVVSILGWISSGLKSALILKPERVREKGHLHRLVTAGWLHADVSHLVFNMITLYFFAGEVSRVMGPTQFLTLYLSAVPMAFIPTVLRYSKDKKYATLGASGAVAAVMFSAVLLVPGLKLMLLLIPIPLPAIVWALCYLAYSVWHSQGESDGINHDAHFFGALYGAIFTYAFEPTKVEKTVRGFIASARALLG